MPVIANYFQVTIDELLGNDKIKSEEKIQYYLNEYDKLWSLITDESYKERISIAKQAYKEYPYDWRIINMLCDTFVYGGWNDEENYEENKQFIRKLCNMIYDEFTNDKFRRNAITYMIRLSEGEEEEKWLNKIDDRLNQKEEREWNYLSKGRKEEAFLLYQQNMRDYVNHLNWKLSTHHQNYADLVSPDDQIAVLKLSGDLLELIYNGDANKSLIYEDMARLYFSWDDKENGYLYLEKAVDTWIKCLEISESEDIQTYKSPLFNRLQRHKLQRNAGTNIYLNNLKTEKGYDSVRNEERFIQCISRLEELQ